MKSNIHSYCYLLVLVVVSCQSVKEKKPVEKEAEPMTDAAVGLHALQPDYPIKYVCPSKEEVIETTDKILKYLGDNTPAYLVNAEGERIVDMTAMPDSFAMAPGHFRLTSYEWGVTYAGMIQMGAVSGNPKYADYAYERLDFLKKGVEALQSSGSEPKGNHAFTKPMHPHALDHAGAMCAAMIKAQSLRDNKDYQGLIDNYIDFISHKQFRLKDGTLARNRPLPNTIWLDDLFMSVPALAHYGASSEQALYLNDAVKQVLLFSERMFHDDKGLYQHGWVQDMDPHPAFFWGRANGWAVMTLAELLSVLPENHPDYIKVMNYYKKHIAGLAALQDGTGFWHQLLDRNDSYLETSCTAIYCYAIVKGINEGWLDPKAYGPMAILAWNAVSSMVNNEGQVEGTCVGTGMAFDPAFYFYRPVSKYAAHGYGPVLLAASELVSMIDKFDFELNDSALMNK